MLFLNILAVALILSFLVFIHELGHFWAAKRNGIRVDEFGIGFPPRLFKYKKGETTYVINLLPLGGYVKLHGEDSSDKKAVNDKDSFAVKTPWQKLQVVMAGVIMNFLVFWVLMSIAFTIGVNPIISNQAQLQQALLTGQIKTMPGLMIKEVIEDNTKFGVNDKLVSVNDKLVEDLTPEELENVMKDLNGYPDAATKYVFLNSESQPYSVEVPGDLSSDLGIEMYSPALVSALNVRSVENDSVFLGFVLPGDKIVKINEVPVLDINSVMQGLYTKTDTGELRVGLLRDTKYVEAVIKNNTQHYVISGFSNDSNAEKSGVKAGDRLIAVDGLIVTVGDQVYDRVKEKGVEKVVYTFEREGAPIDILLEPDKNGQVGMYLSPEFNLGKLGVSFYQDQLIGSVVEQEKIKVPFYAAPIVALSKGTEISVETAKMFMQTLFNVATKLEVSEQVGGPVQVAKLSYHFVDKGGVDLISFIALISLSLAVINILPIPALDGGRLVFVIIEAFRGKPLSPRIEAMVHSFGFIFLMGFILVVTFYDIIRI